MPSAAGAEALSTAAAAAAACGSGGNGGGRSEGRSTLAKTKLTGGGVQHGKATGEGWGGGVMRARTGAGGHIKQTSASIFHKFYHDKHLC